MSPLQVIKNYGKIHNYVCFTAAANDDDNYKPKAIPGHKPRVGNIEDEIRAYRNKLDELYHGIYERRKRPTIRTTVFKRIFR